MRARSRLARLLATTALVALSIWAQGQSAHVASASPHIATPAVSDSALAPGDDAPSPQEQQLLELANADRRRFGLPALAFDTQVLPLARQRASTLSSGLSHMTPTGEVAVFKVLDDAGVAYDYAGENLVRVNVHDSGVLPAVNDALMNSASHRANILEPSFNRLAVGCVIAPDGRLLAAEIFLTVNNQTLAHEASDG